MVGGLLELWANANGYWRGCKMTWTIEDATLLIAKSEDPEPLLTWQQVVAMGAEFGLSEVDLGSRACNKTLWTDMRGSGAVGCCVLSSNHRGRHRDKQGMSFRRLAWFGPVGLYGPGLLPNVNG